MRLGFVFFNYAATPEIYSLSRHDALPTWVSLLRRLLGSDEPIKLQALASGLKVSVGTVSRDLDGVETWLADLGDRKSTRLNSSHANISYAVFCLKKKN